MIKNRWRTTAFKIALAGLCTALCVEGMLQRGLYVPACAEDSEEENYIESQEWQEYKSYWVTTTDKQINNFVATQSPELQAQYLTYILAGNMAIANMQYQENAIAMRADPNTGAIDYSVDIPAGSIQTGWYYRGGKPHSGIIFFYGTSGDPISINSDTIIYASGDDFTIGLHATLNSNYAYHTIYSSVDSYGNYTYRGNFNNVYDPAVSFDGTLCSGFMANVGLYSWPTVHLSGTSDSICTYDQSSLPSSYFVTTGYESYLPSWALLGCLKDSSGSPISNSRQEFIRASVGNNFPDFLLNLKQQLDDEFPEEIVNELWYDPTQGEPLPDVGTLDSLTFPPGLPSSSFNDVELPSEPLPAKMLSGASFWFTQFTNMIDALGVKYIVITFLIIALIMAILKI